MPLSKERRRKTPPLKIRGVYLTRKQIADMLEVSEKTIERQVKAGEFPAPIELSRNRTHRWRTKVVEDHLREREERAQAEQRKAHAAAEAN